MSPSPLSLKNNQRIRDPRIAWAQIKSDWRTQRQKSILNTLQKICANVCDIIKKENDGKNMKTTSQNEDDKTETQKIKKKLVFCLI